MTTIVYARGVLAADNSAVVGNSTTHITEYAKARESRCKRFGYGISGQLIDDSTREKVEALLLEVLIYMQDSSVPVPEHLGQELFRYLSRRDMILMTKEHVYVRDGDATDKGRVGFVHIPPGEHAAIGTGREWASSACVYGLAAVDAIEYAKKWDFFTYPSVTLKIVQAKLKPLPKEAK
jgi:hypothetical protein